MNPANPEAAAGSAPMPSSAQALAQSDARRMPARNLDASELHRLVALLDGWEVHGAVLQRHCSFANYHDTMAFVNAVAWIAHRSDHHPDLQVGYNRCQVQWSTHSTGGLTLKDLICAAQVDALLCPSKA